MKYKVGDEVNVLTDISPERLRELEESGVHITKVTPTEEWEKTFDERFHRVGMDTNFGFTDGLDGYEQLKSFIRHLLTSHDAELARKIEGMGGIYDKYGVEAMWIKKDAVLALLTNKNL